MTRNRLRDASSPYLLQHASNPVHWFEWGEEAFAEARARDLPVLLSVGYASCHWCHVMAHESFEDPDIAKVMNRDFINIKVDREERPDVDRIYMDAVQTLSGRGGWPMTVFLTPDGKPFYAGTYYPPTDRPGHPSFRKVLAAMQDAWTSRRAEVNEQAQHLTGLVSVDLPSSSGLPDERSLIAAYEAIRLDFDPINGGFGGAPKFPQVSTLEFLLRNHDQEWAPDASRMLRISLAAMAAGGIRDHVAGGFARYSVDSRWSVPHFEKMLSDNALLVRLYARAAQVTGDAGFATVARETAQYLLTDLRLPEGGFASGEDADSDGEEGVYYVFTRDAIAKAAGDFAEPVCEALGVTEDGNFEGANVLQRSDVAAVAARFKIPVDEISLAVSATLAALRSIRATRNRPARDDKVIAAWNGLAARGLAEAGVALGDSRLVDAAIDAARFVLTTMRRSDGRLHRSWRRGRLGPIGYCDDHAAMALACFALYQATGDETWFVHGADLAKVIVEQFADTSGDGFFATAHDAERLITRPKNLFDLPAPSDNSLAAEVMLSMSAFTGESDWRDHLEGVLRLGARMMTQHPAGAGHMLAVAGIMLAPPLEVAVVGAERDHLVKVVNEAYRPRVFLAQGDGRDTTVVPLLMGRPASATGASAYVCEGFVCDRPVSEPEDLRNALSEVPSG